MRKYITKEITNTTFTIAEITIVKGKPVSTILSTDFTLIGKPSDEKAIREYRKTHQIETKRIIVVLSRQETITTYQLELSQFLKMATIKESEL